MIVARRARGGGWPWRLGTERGLEVQQQARARHLWHQVRRVQLAQTEPLRPDRKPLISQDSNSLRKSRQTPSSRS